MNLGFVLLQPDEPLSAMSQRILENHHFRSGGAFERSRMADGQRLFCGVTGPKMDLAQMCNF